MRTPPLAVALLLTLAARQAAAASEPPQTIRDTRDVFTAHAGAFHAAAFEDATVEAIMGDYADDAVLVTSPGPGGPTGVLRGKTEIAGFFKAVIAEFRKPGSEFRLEGEPSFEKNVARFSWSAKTPDHVFRRATDTLVVRDGKIVAQTFSAYIEGANHGEAKSAADLASTVYGEALRRHSHAFRNGDVDIVVNDFAPDAVILTPTNVMRGRDELRRFFQAVLANPNPTFKTSFATTVDNIGFIEWSADGWPWGTDSFLYDAKGKIAIQTFDGFNIPAAPSR